MGSHEESEHSAILFLLLFAVTIATTLVCGMLWDRGETLSGPEFLKYFILVIGVALVGQWIVRKLWLDMWYVRLCASAVVLVVSGTRVLSIWESDMHKFQFLVVLTLAGVFLPFAFSKSADGNCVLAGGSGGGGGGGCGGCGH